MLVVQISGGESKVLPSGVSDKDWFELVPKVELHLHLEGAMPLWALWELVQKYGGKSSLESCMLFNQDYAYADFSAFDRVWRCKNGFLREYEDFRFIAEATAKHLAAQNIHYLEAFFCPSDFAHHGLETQRLIEAIRCGLGRVSEVKVSLVIDLARDQGPRQAAATLAQIDEVREFGVIGVGMGGTECEFPLSTFEEVYEKARQFGFHTTAHAGETAGADSVWEAIRRLRVERIGHGTRAIEDESLVEYLAQHRIPLEVCPLSNVQTRVVSELKEHPVRSYFERGILLSINTDDPVMFGNSLAQEFRMLERWLGFTHSDIRKLILQGIETSWLAKREKAELIREFQESVIWKQGIDS